VAELSAARREQADLLSAPDLLCATKKSELIKATLAPPC
jgi:hypothetical protein